MIFGLFYLGILFLGGGWVYHRLTGFTGEIVVPQNQYECLVARPSNMGTSLSSLERNLPVELLSFDAPKAGLRYFDARKKYDTVQLPFRLRVEKVHTLESYPDRNMLTLRHRGDKKQFEAKAGTHVRLATFSATVEKVAPWTGLIRTAKGAPMACLRVATEPDAWSEPLFLQNDAWASFLPAGSVYFKWFRTEKAARAALPETLPDIESARWGVREGQKTHWFRTFAPGTGVGLEDGGEITLLRYVPDHEAGEKTQPAIEVEVREAGGKRDTFWVTANTPADTSNVPVLFEFPVKAETVAYIHAWRFGKAVCRLFFQGALIDSTVLETEQVWKQEEKTPVQLRLEQVMADAVSVSAKSEAIVHEAFLRTAQGALLRLREGQSLRQEDVQIGFRRVPTPPKVEYEMTALYPRTKKKKEFRIVPGRSTQVGDWSFFPMPKNPYAADTAVLIANHTFGGPAKIFGAILFVLGSVGMVILRFRRHEVFFGEELATPLDDE